jgi:hypothetical protein
LKRAGKIVLFQTHPDEKLRNKRLMEIEKILAITDIDITDFVMPES